jgi:formylglycine-generating enzyme required for sulfatase activity
MEPAEVATWKDGKEMVYIPPGEFLMGDDKTSTHVDGYYIDRYPVTNADYARFCEETGHDKPPPWYNTGTYPEGKGDHPVVQVVWSDAVAYAEWAGKRLPSQAEWEKAARGTDGREWPWGNEFDKTKCNTYETDVGTTTPVGKYSPDGDSPYGVGDMAGNVYEWTANGSGLVLMPLRGGSWNEFKDEARCVARRKHTPRRKNDFIGFRCAADVPKE